MTRTWRFNALDTLFFRDSRPHGSAGAVVLASLFPPSARTVAGLIRFLIGNALDADWARFKHAKTKPYHPEGVDLLSLIGMHDDYGKLTFTGPWLAVEVGKSWRRLYPAPRTLLVDEAQRISGQLVVGPPVECDLGRLRLPGASRPFRSAERIWLDRDAYALALRGGAPVKGIYPAAQLFVEEPRLGISRTLAQHTATPGLLYQTRHVRPRELINLAEIGGSHGGLAIEIGVACGEEIPATIAQLARLGGEGRLVGVEIEAADDGIPEAPEPRPEDVGLTLNLLTPADLAGQWLPEGFSAGRSEGRTVWHGSLHGVNLTIHSAAIGKEIREGGWDLAAGRPRAVRSLVPAGSAWYATVTEPDGSRSSGLGLAAAIRALHGRQLSPNPLGLGQIAVGTLDAQVFPDLEDS